ncbi:hypothetical protein [Thermococcus sp. Bubb.Bath]|nr:hypothetical protein [Thermococcus sp. Bubb.Bath]
MNYIWEEVEHMGVVLLEIKGLRSDYTAALQKFASIVQEAEQWRWVA